MIPAAVIAVLVVAFAWTYALEIRRVAATPLNAWTEDITADCGIVLTGGANRVRDGFDLLARHSIRKLIISGVHAQADLTDIFPELPFYASVNPDDVVLERRSQTTYGNAQQSMAMVEALHCQDAVLITSRLHMYRAFRTFKAEFPPNFNLNQRAVFGALSDQGWTELGWEGVKSLFYSLWVY